MKTGEEEVDWVMNFGNCSKEASKSRLLPVLRRKWKLSSGELFLESSMCTLYVLVCMFVNAWVHVACMWECASSCVYGAVWACSGVSGLEQAVSGIQGHSLWPRVGDSLRFSEWSSSSFLLRCKVWVSWGDMGHTPCTAISAGSFGPRHSWHHVSLCPLSSASLLWVLVRRRGPRR